MDACKENIVCSNFLEQTQIFCIKIDLCKSDVNLGLSSNISEHFMPKQIESLYYVKCSVLFELCHVSPTCIFTLFLKISVVK